MLGFPKLVLCRDETKVYSGGVSKKRSDASANINTSAMLIVYSPPRGGERNATARHLAGEST
jgi:hypothetical protein